MSCSTETFLPPLPRSGRRLALDAAEAVAYLHGDMRILHSDIK